MNNLFGKDMCKIIIDMDKVYISHIDFNKDTREHTTIRSKYMTMDGFVDCIKNMNKSMSTPILPQGCFKYSVSNENSTYYFFIKEDRVVGKCRMLDGTIGSFPNMIFPAFIMAITFTKSSFYSSKIYALKDISSVFDLKDNTPLYKMMFPNVHSDDNICWGHSLDNGDFGSVGRTPRTCALLPDIFRISVFNNDLFSDSFNKIMQRIGTIKNLEGYFEHLVNCETYPAELYEPLNLNLGGIF